MCIRDRVGDVLVQRRVERRDLSADLLRNVRCGRGEVLRGCLLYTSDAADERSRVDLGGRRIIKKKKIKKTKKQKS